MSPAKPTTATNRLLSSLPKKDRHRLLDCCEPVDLTIADVLAEPHERIRHLYFPTDSFISLTASINGSAKLEVGLVGNEGMLGASLLLGVNVAPLHALVQGKGAALRIDTSGFRRELSLSPALQQRLKCYLFVEMKQLALMAACTHFHVVEARLARWLLMTQDRAHSDRFYVTHEFLALMLGVRRVGVTEAATSLQNQKLIQYSRGNVIVLDRSGLEAASCSCYAEDNLIYSRVMG